MFLVHSSELYYCSLALVHVVFTMSLLLVEAVLMALTKLLCQSESQLTYKARLIISLDSGLLVLHHIDYTYFSSVVMHSNLWVVDNGASSHFFAVREDFITLSPSESGTVLGISIRVRRHGSCKLILVDSAGRESTISLNGVLYFPDLALRSNDNYL